MDTTLFENEITYEFRNKSLVNDILDYKDTEKRKRLALLGDSVLSTLLLTRWYYRNKTRSIVYWNIL